MSKLQQLKRLISYSDGDELIEKGLILTLISDIEDELESISKDIQSCFGTCTNKPALIIKINRLTDGSNE